MALVTQVSPRTGGPFMAPGGAPPAPGFANTTFPAGGSSTVTGGGPAGGGAGSPYGDLLRKLIERKLAATEPAKKKGGLLRANTARPGPQRRGGGAGGGEATAADPLAARKALDQYQMTLKSAAMRPVGVGPGMIPGMAADPRLLPPSMLPGGSSFAPTTGSPVPTGSIESPEWGDDALYGYSQSNPRADALGGMIGGGIDPLAQPSQMQRPPAPGSRRPPIRPVQY